MKKEVEKAVKLLTALISTPSLSREEDKTAQIIQDFLEGEGIAVSRTGNNILATYEGAEVDRPYIMLCSHHDTVKPNLICIGLSAAFAMLAQQLSVTINNTNTHNQSFLIVIPPIFYIQLIFT